MKVTSLIKTALIWAILVSIGICASKRMHKMTGHGGPDKVAADEQQSPYPALDLEEICKQAKNPKCEGIIDNFCIKSCSAKLCAKHGSIRAMCRLMCEAEDLLPQCSKMGPSQGADWVQSIYPFPNQQFYQQAYPPPQY
jgi:hypothetical protein